MSPKGLFPMHPDFHGWRPPPGASGFGRGNGAEKCQGLAGTNGFFGAVKAEVFVSFFFCKKTLGVVPSCVGIVFSLIHQQKEQTLGPKKLGQE